MCREKEEENIEKTMYDQAVLWNNKIILSMYSEAIQRQKAIGINVKIWKSNGNEHIKMKIAKYQPEISEMKKRSNPM